MMLGAGLGAGALGVGVVMVGGADADTLFATDDEVVVVELGSCVELDGFGTLRMLRMAALTSKILEGRSADQEIRETAQHAL